MIQIAQVPFQKTYRFPIFSDAMALKLIFYLASVLLPFFAVYSVNNFYLSFTDSQNSPTITYNYNYHITIHTNESSVAKNYVYSTLYRLSTDSSSQALDVSYQQNPKELTHNFDFQWQKDVSDVVTKVSVITFFNFVIGQNTGVGIATVQGRGFNLANLNFVGSIDIKNGLNLLTNPPTQTQCKICHNVVTQLLISNEYDFGATQLSLQQNYNKYIHTSANYLSNNMPNSLLKVSVALKTPEVIFQVENASILGQLIWSFRQFFPVACVCWLASTTLLAFLLREHIVKRIVIHQKI